MNVKKHIPNFITLLNLLCGCIAIVFISDFRFDLAFYFVCLGIFLDFFDGFFARLFKVSGALGLQLDSLADMVTSGVAPGFAMVYMIAGDDVHQPILGYLPYLGFVITLGACYRLANFNIDTRQTDSFIGLPTPANALLILSLPLVLAHNQGSPILEVVFNKWVLIGLSFVSAFIMNAEIPLFSLKIKNFSVKKNALQVFFLATAAVFLILFRYLGIPMIIIFYVLLSIINNRFAKK
jgi:CDP-diacylglycerol---serine O-phosphatidyltransferase